jgi:dipeptidyl-peptidase 4
MKRISLLSYFLIAFFVLPQAQDKKLTIEDASYMNRSLFPSSIKGLGWRAATDQYTNVENNSLVVTPASAKKGDTLLKLDELNRSLADAGKDEMKGFPGISWTGENEFTFIHKNTLYSFNTEEKMLSERNNYPEEAKNADLSPDNKTIAYTIDNNLYTAIGGRQVQVTNNEEPGIMNGQEVHRREFGINTGTFWSPEGRYLAFYRKDETMVTDYPLIDIKKRIAKPDPVKYPMAGMTSHEVTLGVYDPEKGSTVFLDTGEPADQYLTCVTWGPEENYIYIAVLNRDQNHMKLNKYDAETGAFVKTLFEEKDEEYVEPENQLYFLNETTDRFLWMSERDGFKHLYLYDTEGNLIEQITSGEWLVKDYLGTDSDDDHAYFTATKNGPLNNELYSVNLRNLKINRITTDDGTHFVIPSEDFEYFIDVFSDTVTARTYSIINNKGKLMKVLMESEDPLREYNTGETDIFTLKAEDGTDLYCRMIRPPDFDPGKKYPAIIYVYGGPHAQLVTNSWMGGASLFLHYLAQQGYVVFTLDNRGSANRGLEFEQSVFRNLGTLEVRDQMTGVEYLRSLPYIDAERIGAHGWSYGGFMTISLMLKQPETFKTGVCGGPVTDWKYYEIMYGERDMDTPESNPEGYESSSLLNLAENLEGKLLIIHGTYDPVVVWQHSLDLIDRFIKEGKQVDYFVYPGHGHGVGGRDRVHLNRKMADYFMNNL